MDIYINTPDSAIMHSFLLNKACLSYTYITNFKSIGPMVHEEKSFKGCPKYGLYKKIHKPDVMGP